jgi:uncharacterized protein YcfJ
MEKTMNRVIRCVVAVGGVTLATQAAAQITLYEGEGFHGRAYTANGTVWNLDPTGFNDRASSAIIQSGRWEVCEDARFQGRCVVLGPGNYPSLGQTGLERRISSIRPAGRNVAYAYDAPPPPAPMYEYRVRPSEQLFQAPVTSVHAVVGPPEQRCWVERQQVQSSGPNVPGAIIGAVIGGVLGHQVGGGRGQDIATAGGAVAGGAIGANVGRGGTYGQDVQRCEAVPGSARADYWDVTYNFRGLQHRVQLSAPPGPTITVNGNGEPRG